MLIYLRFISRKSRIYAGVPEESGIQFTQVLQSINIFDSVKQTKTQSYLKMSTFPPCHCEICIPLTPNGKKYRNRSMSLTPNRHHACRKTENFNTSFRRHQSPINCTAKLTNIGLKMAPKIEPKRVSSPARRFSYLKTVTKTPHRFQPKSLLKIQSKLNQSLPILGEKSKSIAKNQMANNSVIESAEKCDVNSNMCSQTVDSNVVAVESVILETKQQPLACEEIKEISMRTNEPSLAKLSTVIKEITNTQQPEASVVKVDDKILRTKDDDNKTTSTSTSPQSKWADEVLKLLNTGSEKQISNKLATVGLKSAAMIIKCREIRGKYEQLGDLQKKLGWSDKVYQKFLMNNFLSNDNALE